jgi:rhodanese-related sulfurtransferase
MIKNAKFVEEVSQEFDKDDEIVVACQSGRRSMMAVTELRAVVHYFPLHTFFI